MLNGLVSLSGDALIASVVSFLVTLLAMAFVLYVAGRMVVGEKATFGSAITIALVGSIVAFILNLLLPILGGVIALLAWWYLIKSQFDTGWLAAFAIGILAVIVSVIVSIVVSIIFGISLSLF